MVFSSLLFVFLFLTLNLVCYYSVKTIRQKNIVLLVFSLIFYAWGGAAYLLLLAGMAFWSWLCALMIEKNEEQKTRKLWMWAECLVLLGLLIFFKYMNFLTGNLSALIGFPKEATKSIPSQSPAVVALCVLARSVSATEAQPFAKIAFFARPIEKRRIPLVRSVSVTFLSSISDATV